MKEEEEEKMAKNWYPVIDYILCEECGTCVEGCVELYF